jgi:hypothetical protein
MSLRATEVGCIAVVFASAICACTSSSPPASPGMGEPSFDAAPADDSSAGLDGNTQGTPSEGGRDAPGDGSPDASAMTDGSSGDASDESSLASDAGSDADAPDLGPLPTPVCPPNATWGQGTQLAISTAVDDLMGAVTPDELTIAWISTGASGSSVLVADRASAQAAFGAAVTAPAGGGTYAATKVALSPDGLRTLVVATDHKSFDAITRASKSGSFAPLATGGEADAINSNVAQGEAGFFLDDPVIGAHDATFYYSLYGSGLVNTLHESTRTGVSAWPNGAVPAETAGEFDATGTQLRHPTGVSEDDLTLFYWDDVDGTQKVAWRARTTDPFGAPVLLSGLRDAVPNVTCDKLYYSAPGTAGGLDLFVATRR